MKRIALALCFCCCSLAAWAQTTLRGKVVDSTQTTLPIATVMLLHAKDSALATFGRTDANGDFVLRNVANGNYILKITYTGYQNYLQPITTSGGLQDLGTIVLQPKTRQLSEVVIKGERDPVKIKKDTIEFNASSFETNRPNAVVEDLLKRLPGVQVEKDGSIKVQGENVQRVTVNGKNFFGQDAKLATRNLPAKAIEKIQIFDRLSDQAQFSGIDDGTREKTINLELKEEFSNGSFGNFAAGAGIDSQEEFRYETKASYNRFTKTTQLSFLGMGNNINQQGFSPAEYFNFMGRSSGGMIFRGGGMANQSNLRGVPVNFGGRPNGIMTNWAGGINFNHTFNAKTEVNGSYFFSDLVHRLEQQTTQINFLPNGNFSNYQDSRQNNQTTSHRLNATLNHKIDSANTLRYNLVFSLNNNRFRTLSDNQTLNAAGVLQNEGVRDNATTGAGMTWNNELLFRHRFAKHGRTLSATLVFNTTSNQSDGQLQATNRFFNPQTGQLARAENINQVNSRNTITNAYGGNLSYTEPIGKRKYLELNYNVRNTVNKSDQKVFDLNNGERLVNQNLTNEFENYFLYQRWGANFRYVKQQLNLTVGLNYQNSDLQGNVVNRGMSIRKNFSNLLPSARLRIDFSSSKRLNLDYDTDINPPSITQLQPLIDNTDPLNIYVGNPDLRPEYNHRFRANYFMFDQFTSINFFGGINATYTTNKIVNGQSIDQRFVRTTQPVNVADFINASANINFGFPVRPLKSRLNLSTRGTGSRSINLLNNELTYAYGQNLVADVRYEFRPSDRFDFALTANLNKQRTTFDRPTSVNQNNQQNFLNQTYGAEMNLVLPLDFRLNIDYDYFLFTSQTTGFRQELPLLNASLSKLFLKGAGELKLGVNNFLDQSLGVSQQADVNFLQQTVVNNLGRFFMVSFIYSLNKALNPTNNFQPGRGGMMRMMIN
ncbi:MAG: outer membrane beta-barrel protein [Cytophagales bacterium]|nr:outer membrane beta-barrel protein [Bernardetiaceae bacterium]MDW8211199.1 outer membrane beta-barrel protein [Cytophagales bacterium]